MSRSKKQEEALQAVLVSAVIKFAGTPQTREACDRLVAKLLSIWAISAQLVESQSTSMASVTSMMLHSLEQCGVVLIAKMGGGAGVHP